MLISTSLQMLLLTFEVIVCDNLETRRNSWNIAFIPLLFISLLSIPICFWSLRHGRGIELEFFAALNFLQILFIGLKLDFQLTVSWVVVFLPTWVLLSFTLVIIIYVTIIAAMLARSPDLAGDGLAERHRANFTSIPTLSTIFVPISLFLVMLTNKLDSPPHMLTPGYFLISVPLFLALIILTHSTFGSRPGSLWWFGMRTDFCTFLLNQCPCLKEFGNTSYTRTSQPANVYTVSPSDFTQTDDGYQATTVVNTDNESIDTNTTHSRQNCNNQQDNEQRAGVMKTIKRWLRFKKGTSQQNLCNSDIANNDCKNSMIKLAIDTPD